jgi:ribonuclease D
VRYVLSDIALTGIAQRPPRERRDLEKVRGFDRGTRDDVANEILGAVKAGLADTSPIVDDVSPGGVEKDLRPAIALISAWIAQLARDLELDASLLATRGDIEAFLRGDVGARLAEGWRDELAGRPVRSLLEGGAAVAFAGNGELVIEERSRRPLS